MNNKQGKEQTTQMRKLIITIACAACLVSAMHAEPREHRKSRDYTLRRQEAYQVQGLPTERLIIGRREIDVYRNGLMFEKDNVVGVKRP